MRVPALLLSTLLLISARAWCQDAAKEVASQAEALSKTLQSNDSAAITALAAPDFKFTDIFGREGNAEKWSERIKGVVSMAKDPVVAPLPPAVTPKGDTAIAMVKVKVTGVGKDRLGDEGPLDMTVTHRTEWAKDGVAWKLKSAREVYFQGTANRRPINFSKTMAEEETRKGLQSMYGAMSEIYEKRDWEKIEKGVSDDFVIMDMEGKRLTKAELIDRIKAGTDVVSNPIMTIDPQQVAFDGDRLFVIRVMRLLGDVAMPDGKTGRVVYLNIARDAFQKGEKDWKPTSSTELHAEATVNGVPIPLSLISGKK